MYCFMAAMNALSIYSFPFAEEGFLVCRVNFRGIHGDLTTRNISTLLILALKSMTYLYVVGGGYYQTSPVLPTPDSVYLKYQQTNITSPDYKTPAPKIITSHSYILDHKLKTPSNSLHLNRASLSLPINALPRNNFLLAPHILLSDNGHSVAEDLDTARH